MTLQDFFKKYPVVAARIAKEIGFSREWIAGVYSGRTYYTPQTKKKYIKQINEIINRIGREMAVIKLTDGI